MKSEPAVEWLVGTLNKTVGMNPTPSFAHLPWGVNNF